MDGDLKGKWFSECWEAQKRPYTAVNHILRMYYDSRNASEVLGDDVLYNAHSNEGFEVDHFIGIQFVAN
jgi:hypothetical protein